MLILNVSILATLIFLFTKVTIKDTEIILNDKINVDLAKIAISSNYIPETIVNLLILTSRISQ